MSGVTRIRSVWTGLDRGWKATVLGVAIVGLDLVLQGYV